MAKTYELQGDELLDYKAKAKTWANHDQVSKQMVIYFSNWCKQQNLPFGPYAGFKAIFDHCKGNYGNINKFIDNLTKPKTMHGRSSTVFGDPFKNGVSLKWDPNSGKPVAVGEADGGKKEKELSVYKNPNIVKKDGTTKKDYQTKEAIFNEIGDYVRKKYPGESNDRITSYISNIYKYSVIRKKGYKRVLGLLESGRLPLETVIKVVTNYEEENGPVKFVFESRQGKIVYITKDMARQINEFVKMTKYKFVRAIKGFLHDLLVDPVNAKVPFIFKAHGFSRYDLIRRLMNEKILFKKEQIIDKDEEGNYRKATMKVTYKVMKKDFERKIRNLYIKMFEKNVPKRVNECDGGCGCGDVCGTTNASSSGQVITPIFGQPIRREIYNTKYSKKKKKKELDETTATTNVGNYTYDVPAPVDSDDPSLKRNEDEENGSISINHV